MLTIGQDVRHTARSLLRNRAFAAIAVLTLGLGIGANAGLFTVAWNLLLEPLPWPDAERIVQIWNTQRATGAKNIVAPANYLDLEREATSFEAVAAYTSIDYSQNLTGAGNPAEMRLRAVTGSYFRVFGTPAALGRTLDATDEREARRVIVLNDGTWRRQFGANREVVGTSVVLDDVRYEVVGVMPPGFDVAVRPVDGWIPYYFTPELRERRLGFFLGVVGRLRPSITVEQARYDVEVVAARASERFPASNARIGATLNPMADEIVGPIRAGVLLLAAGAAVVLLMACTNLTSLLLARASGRRREMAVRAAVGATRARLVRYLMIESLIIAAAAGGVGLIAGLWAVQVAALAAPPTLARASALTLDAPVIVSTLVLSFVAAALLGSVTAWRATRPAPVDVLRGRAGAEPGAGTARSVLVTTEVALATLLLASAAVLLGSMIKVLRLDPGFDATGVVVADVRLPISRYDSVDRRTLFFNQVFDRMRDAPGVEATCATNDVPLESTARMTYVPDGTETLVGALPITVSPGCFQTLRLKLVRGRLFETREPEPVAIVSEAFARRAFPGGAAVGGVIRIGLPTGEPLTIVGVVADSRRVSLEAEPFGQVYEPASQSKYFAPQRIMVRSSAAPDRVVTALTGAVRDIDPAQPVSSVRTLDAVVSRSVAARRFTVTLIGGFALAALLLAGVGLYGLLSQVVAQRQPEIGVRMALGATPASVVWLITRDALRAVAIGVPCGLAASLTAARVLSRFVYGMSAADPAVLAGTVLTIAALAATAAFVPTRRATKLDPLTTLRAE